MQPVKVRLSTVVAPRKKRFSESAANNLCPDNRVVQGSGRFTVPNCASDQDSHLRLVPCF